MHNIQSVSRILHAVFILLFCLTPLVYAAYWLDPTHTLVRWGWQLAGVSNAMPPLSQLSLPIRATAWVVSWIPMVVDLFIWYFLIRLFNAYRAGHIFSRPNARAIRNIGITLLVWELLNFPYQILLTFVMTSTQPAGHHFIAVSYSNHDLTNILVAVTIIVIGCIMQRGAELAEEQALTV